MKHYIYILLFLFGIAIGIQAQSQGGGRNDRSSFSLANLNAAKQDIPDSLLTTDDSELRSRRIIGYKLTPVLGSTYIAPMDTNRLNSSNSTLVESKSLAVGYLANYGSPAQTRIFSERTEPGDFIFANLYEYYTINPENALFYDTKIPYTYATYESNGSSQNKNERFMGLLTTNFGKKINIGAEMDYIYGRGHYNSNGNKMLSYRFWGSYRSDKYELNAYVYNYNFVAHENGGLTNDSLITHPDDFNEGKRVTDTKAFPVRYSDVYNRVRGKQFFFTHRYNLGFNRTIRNEDDPEEEEKDVFVPVSSIIHTFLYEDNRRHFYSNSNAVDTCYTDFYGPSSIVSDRSSTWNLKNTVALSLREGFQDWVKFGLAAFVRFEKRKFKMPSAIPTFEYEGQPINNPAETNSFSHKDDVYDEFSTYIGAELSKQQGSILTYNARGELAIVGDDVGEFRAIGELQTRFPLFNKEASIKVEGYLKNVTPAFFMRHNHSRYFWWDMKLKNEQQVYAGATVHLESTRTQLSAGINSIQNYTFFNKTGLPEQYESNLQVINVRLKQDFRYRALGWENEFAYQLSSKKEVLPLPTFSAYTNAYLAFKLAKVLTVQIGANLYYHTEYKAPYYEPATQQFQLQDEVKVGNYPLMNAYINFHLKQARFYVMGYNLSQKFVDPNYFSLAHYPLNPMVLKLGVAVYFNN